MRKLVLVGVVSVAGFLSGCDNKPTAAPAGTAPPPPAGHEKFSTQTERIPKSSGAPTGSTTAPK
jgi:hypothetical protein